jgi:hypothetical protein
VREVCFLLDEGGEVLWSDASQSPSHLPDSRERWEALWARREVLSEVAHSHPCGPLAFSREDETTMQALTHALGRALRFSVVAPTATLVREPDGSEHVLEGDAQPAWARDLRFASGMIDTSGAALRKNADP